MADRAAYHEKRGQLPEVKAAHAEAKRRYNASASGRKKVSSYNRAYAQNHRSDRAEYMRVRYAEDLQFRLRSILRARLRAAIGNGQKTGSAVADLGCTIPELIAYLEGLFAFQPIDPEHGAMSWTNRGSWHIDHVRPLASFDLTDREQFLRACHFSNLQPLWGPDNVSKGSKWPT